MKHAAHLCTLLLVTLALTGCVKIKQVWQLNPDRSGKLTMTVGVSEQMLQMAGGEDPFEDLANPKEMISEEDNGWVAFTEPQVETRDGFKYATFTGYFEDINQVAYRGDGGEGEMEPTTYQLDEGKLVVSNPMLAQVIASIAGDPAMNDPQQRSMMAPMMQGLEMSETYMLPGQVTDAEGYRVDGRSAQTTVDDKALLGDEPPKIEGLDDGQLTVTFEPAGWEGGEQAWQQELAEAKTEWERIKQTVGSEAAETVGAE